VLRDGLRSHLTDLLAGRVDGLGDLLLGRVDGVVDLLAGRLADVLGALLNLVCQPWLFWLTGASACLFFERCRVGCVPVVAGGVGDLVDAALALPGSLSGGVSSRPHRRIRRPVTGGTCSGR
jgi:hypothetical protein